MTSISVTRRPQPSRLFPERVPLARLAGRPVPPPVRRLLERRVGGGVAGFTSSI